jgi:hypothetical protein
MARAQAMRHLWPIQPPFPAIAAKFHRRSFKLARAQGMIGSSIERSAFHDASQVAGAAVLGFHRRGPGVRRRMAGG